LCRVLITYGRLSALRGYYPELIRGLVGASHYDPYKARLAGPEAASHGDGWGRVTAFVGSGGIAVSFYRSLAPIYVDTPPQSIPETSIGRLSDLLLVDMVHARAASRGMPVNVMSVQPFEYQTSTGSRLFLIHNGSVDKEALAVEVEGINRTVLERYSDTYVMGLWLAQRLRDSIDVELLGELKEHVKTALNLGLILVTPDSVELLAGSYYSKEFPQERRDYYKMYYAELPGGSMVLASSTIVDLEEYRPKSIGSWKELENGTFIHARVEITPAGGTKVKVEKRRLL
jgi:glutamine amidotransferase